MDIENTYNLKNFEDNLNKELGARIKKLRILKNLTQKQLADTLNVSFQQVQKYEKGTNKISIAKLVTICSVFMVDINSFIGNLNLDSYSLMQKTDKIYTSDDNSDAKESIKKKIDSLSVKELNKIDVILNIL